MGAEDADADALGIAIFVQGQACKWAVYDPAGSWIRALPFGYEIGTSEASQQGDFGIADTHSI